MPSYHTHTQNRQTTKERSKEVLLSFQLPSNNKMESCKLFVPEDTITDIRASPADGCLRGTYEQKGSITWYFLSPLAPESLQAPHMVL